MGEQHNNDLAVQIARFGEQLRSVAARLEDIKTSVQPVAALDRALAEMSIHNQNARKDIELLCARVDEGKKERDALEAQICDVDETEGYGVPFPYSEYLEMAARLRSLKGRAIVSLNDHPDIRRAFEGFHIETVDIRYTVGGGGRDALRKEVIIFSWDDRSDPVGLF